MVLIAVTVQLEATYLAGVEDVQVYGKNTYQKRGARHCCGRGVALLRTTDLE